MPSRWLSREDSIKAAAATYAENLNIATNLNLIGSGAGTTIIDGQRAGPVIRIYAQVVTLSNITIRNGVAANGGGIYNDYGARHRGLSKPSG